MKKNIELFDRVLRVVFAGILIFAGVVLFEHPVARILILAGGVFFLWEAGSAKCPLIAHLGVTDVNQKLSRGVLYLLGLMGIQAVLAYEWWSAGWEKVSNPAFVDGIRPTLSFFASQNPFPWYKGFLLGFATDNAALFAYAVQWGQIGIGVALISAALAYLYFHKRSALVVSVIALVGGLLMNANFYLAAGWTGPGTHGLNVVMFWIQAILLYVWLKRLVTRA